MSDGYVIFAAERGTWRVGCRRDDGPAIQDVPADPDATIDEQAAALAAALSELGHEDQVVVLAVPSEWCLSAEISTDDLGRGGRHRAMTFRLEEHLPLSAEDMVADFIETQKGKALGIAAGLDRLQPWVDALQTRDVTVGPIVPAALLAARQVAGAAGPLDAVLLARAPAEPAGRTTFDWVELHRAKPACWRWFADDRDAAAEAVRELYADRESTRVLAVGSVDSRWSDEEIPTGVELVTETSDPTGEVVRAAPGAVDHTAPPWVDLRRDQLALPEKYRSARGPMVALVTAAAVLLAVLTGLLWYRGGQYDDLAGRYRRQQREVFRQAVPDQRPPGDVLGRMRSEYRKLAGLGGETLDDTAAANARPTSALVHLRNVLANLPTDFRFRILSMDIEPGGIDIRGEAKSYAQAESIANRLRDTGLYSVEMHESQTLRDEAVSFHFTARPEEAVR